MLESLLANAFTYFEATLITIAVLLVSIAASRLSTWLHLSNQDAIRKALDFALDKGVHAAEEWASRAKDKPTGSAKLDYAINVVRPLLADEKLKKATNEQLQALIEAQLSKHINSKLES